MPRWGGLDIRARLPMENTMRDATGDIQSVLILGANSEIAVALVDELADRRLQRVVLAARDTTTAGAAGARLRERGLDAQVVPYEATSPEAHDAALAAAGDVDVVVVAFGVLGQVFSLDQDTADVAELASLNFSAGVAACTAAARHLRDQGHGALVVLSSVAGVRVRAENAVYGAAKAGLDAFANALADMLHGTGVQVLVVRPGFVHTKMTADRDEAPFATTPDAVARDIAHGLRQGRRIVWSPRILREVFGGLRTLPGPLWRRVAG